MTTVEFLSKLHELGVELRVDGEHLRLNAPKGVISASLKEEIAERKEEILAFLKTAKVEQQTTPSLIPRSEREGVLPLSFSQERLWLLEQLSPGNYAYNMPGAIRLRGELNLVCLEQALDEILTRHEVLRTTFKTLDNQPVQVITHPKSLPVKIIDLSELSVEDQTREAKRLTEEEARSSFDLSKDLLIRATLLKLNSEDHIFLLTMHHIVSDGWSRGIFTREFVTLYQAFLEGKPSPLAPLPIQYTDFARWQRDWLQGETLESQLSYWKQQMAGELPQSELLLDKPRPVVHSQHSARKTKNLSVALCQALRQLSQEEGATLFMTLLAAFKLLLQRYTGLKDIIVGSPIAGRNRSEVENLIGFFINTLVLRTDLAGNPSFRELIGRVKRTAMDAYAHQDIPFEKLLIELHPERNQSRTPLFQVFFNMLNLEEGRADLPGLTVDVFETPDIGSKFDFTLYLIAKDQAIDLELVYNTDLFFEERIEELLAQYELLLMQVVADPEQRIGDYSLLTNQAKSFIPDPTRNLVSSWQDGVQSIFAGQASRVPDQIALLDNYDAWTYQKLDTLSNQLAHFLRGHDIGSKNIVAVYAQRSASLVWALLGILKAGAAFIVLDPAYPAQRLIDYLQIAQPKAWLQLESAGNPPALLKEFLASSSYPCQLVLPASPKQASILMQEYAMEAPCIPIGPDDLAYVAFTSGSTGKPKGILGSHRPLSHFIHWYTQTFSFNETDRFSMFSGLAHDPLLRDIFTPLCLGATLCIPDHEHMLSPGYLLTWMEQQHIAVTHLTPALQQVLVAAAPNGTKSHLPDLRYAFFGGEPLTRQHILGLTRFAPDVTCVNLYGATETPQAMSYSIVDSSNQPKEIIPLGRGIQDVQLLVLNSGEHLAGVGEVGEIFIRTPYLSQGYLKDEGLTQQRFLTNPFTNDRSDRMYKTGDLGRYLPNGEVEFLGRNDTQVKIRGFRIELSEIESVLTSHPGVTQAALSLWETENNDKRLIAYVVPESNYSFQVSEIRAYLKQHLPDYMIPAFFTVIDAIPLTPNGKVNRKALPTPKEEYHGSDHIISEARNDIEEKIVKIWQDLLKVQSISVKDSFFELGGHSLMAVQMFTRINQEFGINLPLATLFQEATIEHLAEVINSTTTATTWSSLIEIEPLGNHPPFFCVHGITGDILWFRELAQFLAPDYPFYGLQARGLDGIQNPISEIEVMAARYIEEIRLLQPNGPYFLGGASFGGTVALEIAQQLVEKGEEVALLAIFDHAPHNIKIEIPYGKFKTRLVVASKLIGNFPFWLKEFLHLGPSRMLMRFRRKLRVAQKVKAQPELNNLEHFDPVDFIDFGTELSQHRLQLISTHYRAMKVYNPKPYPGHVTLFRARSRPLLNVYEPEWGWQKLAPGRVSVINIAGSHEGMFKKPNVYQLAEKLRTCLG